MTSEMNGRRRCGRWRRNLWQQIEGAGRGADRGRGDLQVARGGGQTTVPQQELDGPQIGAGFEEVGGESVSERVRGDRLADPRRSVRLLAGQFDGTAGDRLTGQIARKQPWRGESIT